MRKIRQALLLAPLLLFGCERPPPGEGADTADAGNPLEATARERGIVRPEATSLTGVFERAHNLGRDAMCVVPDGAEEWRFAVTAAFGPGLSCLGQGRVTAEGDGWRLDFDGTDGCSVVVHEQEDELRLPGIFPPQCESLCPGRASLVGLRLPRASWNEDDAKRLQMRDSVGNIRQPCKD